MDLLLAIGNSQQGDDALGPVFARLLRRRPIPGLRALDAGTCPEHFTAPIRQLAPNTLYLLDACQWSPTPGATRFFRPDETSALSFSTHAPDIRLLTAFLHHDLPTLDIRLIAIQPARLAPRTPLSPPVRAALRRLHKTLLHATAAPHPFPQTHHPQTRRP